MPTASARTGRRNARRSVNILFTCVGRRVELIEAFRRAGESLRIDLTIHGADAHRLSPAQHHVDRAHRVPVVDADGYVGALRRIIRTSKIDLLIPLIDSELIAIAQAAERFNELGCTAVVSSPDVIATCRDKLATFRALRAAGIDTPATWTLDQVLARSRYRFPYFLKPRRGSAAMGNYVVSDLDELRVLGRRVPDAIVQEFVAGTEHTLDVYTGLDGVPRCVVPRRRLEVRGGEVSKGLVVKDRAIMAIGRKVAKTLGDCRGVITVQCIVTKAKRIRVIEINPRFGGGVPLAIHAGADFPRWLLMERMGRRPRISDASFRSGIAMLRFDDSVFVPNAARWCRD